MQYNYCVILCVWYVIYVLHVLYAFYVHYVWYAMQYSAMLMLCYCICICSRICMCIVAFDLYCAAMYACINMYVWYNIIIYRVYI